ncbi:MAG TPA: MFS transporter [Spirochaetota bacterium]|nr:MFS transporter [Spirochaetota bacterium]
MASADIKQNDSRYRPWQIKILLATWLAYAGYYFCRKPFYVTKVSISGALGIDSFGLAQLGTAYLVAYMAGQFSSAFFGRKLGPKLLLLAGIMISIVSTFFFGISNSFWTVMLFMSLNGLAQGTGWPGCIGSLAFWFRRKQRGSVLGLWSTCYQIGPVLATLLASFLLGRAGWRWSFFGGSMVLLAVWFVVLVVHPNRPEDAGLPPLHDEDEVTDKPEGVGREKLGWDRDVMLTIMIMGLIYFCIKFLRYALWSWLPWLLNRNFMMSEADAGYLSVIFDICGFAGVIAAGFLSDRIFKGKRAMLSFVMLGLMTVSFFILYFLGSANLAVFTIAIAFAGFMLFGPDSLLSGVGAIDVGSKEGALSAAGIINGMGSIGPIFQEQLVGWMYRRYNQDLLPILIMLVIIAAVSAVLTLLLWLRSRKGLANV